jgi:Rad3-related DNA helicase
MEKSQIISALAARLREALQRKDELLAALAQADHEAQAMREAILVFDPGHRFEEATVGRKSKRLFANGQLAKLLLEAMKKAGTPLTVDELTQALGERSGHDAKKLRKNVIDGLRTLRGRGIVQEAERRNDLKTWRISNQLISAPPSSVSNKGLLLANPKASCAKTTINRGI